MNPKPVTAGTRVNGTRTDYGVLEILQLLRLIMSVLDSAFKFPEIGRNHPMRERRVEFDQVTKWFECKETAYSTKTLILTRVDKW